MGFIPVLDDINLNDYMTISQSEMPGHVVSHDLSHESRTKWSTVVWIRPSAVIYSVEIKVEWTLVSHFLPSPRVHILTL